MMDETKIGASATPLVNVTFNYINGSYTIPHINIKEASIEGVTPMSRVGDIKCVDPDSILPGKLTQLGAESNSMRGKLNPNITVEYGWKGLNNIGVFTRRLTGLITKTAYDITDDGITTVDIHFIETAVEVLQRIKFFDPRDIELAFKKEELKDRTASEKLDWLFDPNNGLSMWPLILNPSGIVLINEANKGTDNPDGKKIELNIGDNLIDLINSLCAKAEHEKVEGYNYSFERLNVKKIGSKTEIRYGWRATPDVEAGTVMDLSYMSIGTLVWKGATSTASRKQLLAFSSDLNSKTHLIHQSQDALTQKLKKFEQKDIDWINQRIRESGYEELMKNETGTWWDTSGMEVRNDLRQAMRDIIIKEQGFSQQSMNDQIKALLDANVFKATATIMGDPTIGTDHAPYYCSFYTDFTHVGGLATSFGDRYWTPTKTKHLFSEGSYKTEIELLTYPKPDKNA